MPLAWAFHVLVTALPDGSGTVAVHPLIADEPAVTVTVVTKPPVHALVENVAVHAPPPGLGELLLADGLTLIEADGLVVVAPKALITAVYAAFGLPLLSNSSGVSPEPA